MEKIIDSAVRQIKKIKSVDAVYLFGSHAKGRTKPYSDIDICIIARKDISSREKERIFSLASEAVDISLFNELPLNIQFRVLKEGKLLFMRNKKTMHDIRAYTVRDYLDFLPTLNRHVQRALA